MYWCCYPHTLRDLVSSVCRIFRWIFLSSLALLLSEFQLKILLNTLVSDCFALAGNSPGKFYQIPIVVAFSFRQIMQITGSPHPKVNKRMSFVRLFVRNACVSPPVFGNFCTTQIILILAKLIKYHFCNNKVMENKSEFFLSSSFLSIYPK